MNPQDAVDGFRARLRERVPDVGVDVAVLGRHDAGRGVGSGRGVGVLLHPRHVLVGPVPSADGPCPTCLALRWQRLRPGGERDALELGEGVVHHRAATRAAAFALDRVAAIVAHAATCAPPRAPAGGGWVWEVVPAVASVTRHVCLADPTCPRCAGGDQEAPCAEVRLRSRPKPDRGVLRCGDLDAVAVGLGDVRAFAGGVCGMLGTEVVRDHASRTLAPATGRTVTRSSSGVLQPGGWSGHDDVHARSAVLAVCEGLERHAGLHRSPDRPVVEGSRRELLGAGHRVPDPRVAGVHDPSPGARGAGTRERPGARAGTFHDDLRVRWSRAWSLRDGVEVLVPEQVVHYGAPADDVRFVVETSSGCALGSCVEEAILHGALELVERDAFVAAWFSASRLPEIATDPGSPATVALVDRMARLGYRTRLFDARTDVGVPVVVAAAERDPTGDGALCLSAAADLDPARAVSGAVREVAAAVTGFAQRTADDRERLLPMLRDFDLVRSLADHAAVHGLPEMAAHASFLLGPDRARPAAEVYRDHRAPGHADLADDVRHVVDLVVRTGHDVLVADQTPPEQRRLGMTTVRVLAPGLLPVDFGWRHQRALRMPRLVTVARRAGWRRADLSPGDVHRVPHPFM